MKHIYKLLFGLLGVSFFLTACNDWLDTEIKDPADLLVSNKSEEYYARLRQYKKSDHPVAFGWFGNWTGTGASYENSLKGLPDSVDFVSLWGNWKIRLLPCLKIYAMYRRKKEQRHWFVSLYLI